MKRRLKDLGRAVGYWLLRAMLALMPYLSLAAVRFAGRRIGDLLRMASRRRRRIAEHNLRIALGDDLPESRRACVMRECFRQFGMFIMESMKMACMPDAAVGRLVRTDPDSERRAREALEAGRGVIFVSAHFGNFEAAARWLAVRGHEVLVVVRAARDARTTDLMTELRRRNGMISVRRDLAGRPMLQTLRNGGCVALLADQNADDVVVPFFGRPTGTVDGPARLALHTGAPIVVGMCAREPAGGFVLTVEGIIHADPSADRQGEIVRITSALNQMIEAAIRRHPEQWLWFHNRWRSSPGGGAP